MLRKIWNGYPLFGDYDTWEQKVAKADKIHAQVTAALKAVGIELETVPRRPDVRIFVQHAEAGNPAAAPITFLNPENHGQGNKETLPADGPKTAMIIVPAPHGSLSDQFELARYIVETLGLENGITQEAANAINSPATKNLIDKAYAPCDLNSEQQKLVTLRWDTGDRGFETIIPVKAEGAKVAYGCRDARPETVMRAQFRLFVQGTSTIPECIENEGMCIAVDTHWQTGEISTKPIVPSVAKGYYGQGYASMPLIVADPEGNVQKIILTLPERAEITIKPNGEVTLDNLAGTKIFTPRQTGLRNIQELTF